MNTWYQVAHASLFSACITYFHFSTVPAEILSPQEPAATSVNETDSVNLVCTARGFLALNVTWLYQNTTQLANSDPGLRIQSMRIEGENGFLDITSTLTIQSADRSDAGNYTCVASNTVFGSPMRDIGQFVLTVNCKLLCYKYASTHATSPSTKAVGNHNVGRRKFVLHTVNKCLEKILTLSLSCTYYIVAKCAEAHFDGRDQEELCILTSYHSSRSCTLLVKNMHLPRSGAGVVVCTFIKVISIKPSCMKIVFMHKVSIYNCVSFSLCVYSTRSVIAINKSMQKAVATITCFYYCYFV